MIRGIEVASYLEDVTERKRYNLCVCCTALQKLKCPNTHTPSDI